MLRKPDKVKFHVNETKSFYALRNLSITFNNSNSSQIQKRKFNFYLLAPCSFLSFAISHALIIYCARIFAYASRERGGHGEREWTMNDITRVACEGTREAGKLITLINSKFTRALPRGRYTDSESREVAW